VLCPDDSHGGRVMMRPTEDSAVHKKAAEKQRKELEAIKPFRLVKYLSVSSLVVVLVSTVVMSSIIARGVKNIVLRKSEEYASLVAENLNHQVFYQFTLPTLITEGEIRLRKKNQYKRLDRVVRNTIHGFSVEKVNIYDRQQILTYSTESEGVGTKGHLGDVFQKALEGATVSVFEGGRAFIGFEWPWGNRIHRLKTYIPMWVERPMTWKRGKVLGVFEIIQDISSDYETIFRFQWLVLGSFTVFVGVLVVALSLIAKRADRIIERRALERKRLEEKLHRAEHLATLGEMIASVSHEIKNPLGIIKSTAQLMRNRMSDEKNTRLASIIVEEAERLNGIVTEFLDFARPKEPEFSICDVADVLKKALQTFESALEGKNIRLETDLRGGIVLADQMLLYRAFFNLISNAFQAMEEKGGILSVKTDHIGINGTGYLEVTIRDTGVGIPKEVQEKIFRPFFTTKERGTGLGLAIARTIIDEHEGEIFVESEEGKGTVVRVRIPALKKED